MTNAVRKRLRHRLKHDRTGGDVKAYDGTVHVGLTENPETGKWGVAIRVGADLAVMTSEAARLKARDFEGKLARKHDLTFIATWLREAADLADAKMATKQ